MPYADTRFLSNKAVSNMEKYIENLRHPKASSKGKKRKRDDAQNIDERLPIREVILDDCKDSFIAAQQNIVKASKNFYDDTGVMAILCRHDRPLWMVNMTSPGERQHYAFALIEMLFSHLPTTWTVGLMYDIGCQLERSMVKV
jgi:hypothetical protein